MSYIQALQVENEATTPIIKKILQACRLLVTSFVPPKHIHSHRRGTVLDRILDAVDQEAKNTTQKQQRQVGWITYLDTVQAFFTVIGTQKHDLSMYIERKLQEMYCTQHGVTYAHSHTQYALYANIVMRGELLWLVHLHTITQRHHMQHLSDTKCTLCKLPITTHMLQQTAHSSSCEHGSCTSSILESVMAQKRVTPWGTLIATPMGHLVLSVNPVKYMRIPHDLCVINLTGEVSSRSMHQAAEHGATNTMMPQVLGSLLTTWYKVQHMEGPPLLPVYLDYAVPRNPYGMTSHILTNPESLHRICIDSGIHGHETQFYGHPTTFVSGSSSILSECMFTSYVFAVSRPLPGLIMVCDRVYGTLASDSRGYAFGGVCGYSKAIATKRVFHRYHILVYDVWISRTSQVLDMYQSRSAQEVYITGSSHAASIQSNLRLIGNTCSPRLSRLSYSDAATNNINLECQLVCMNLISACLAMSHQGSYTAMHAVQRLQPRINT